MTMSDKWSPTRDRSALETWSSQLDLKALAEKFGTPNYVFNAERLAENVARYTRLVDEPERILYPVKTNPAMAVLRRLASLGCGMDCASRDEVDQALLAGVPAARISYNTPAPEFGLIRTLLKSGATVVVDSAELLRRIEDKIPGSHIVGNLFLRINLDGGGDYLQHFQWEEMVHHGSSTSKFGIPAEQVTELLAACQLPVSGLHVHVGTMMDNLTTFENTLQLMHRLVDEIAARTTHRISSVNLGGGLGIGFLPGQEFPAIDDLADRVNSLKRMELLYFAEPGQSLVGDTMGLLMRVLAVKRMRGRNWAIVDVGSDQLMKITTVAWYHQILDQRGVPLPNTGSDAVGGPLCFAGDTILPATDLRTVQEGDVLLLQHAGAYLEAIANRFNGRRSVGMIVIDERGMHAVTQPEDPFFSPPLQTYDWSEWPGAATSATLSPEEIAALRSTYFQAHASEDEYALLSFARTGENTYRFTARTRAEVSFVSVPFAHRIAADAMIIAVMRSMNKTLKDVSVWGTKGSYQYREPIASGRELQGEIALSAVAHLGASQRMLVTASLDSGRFSMVAEVVV
jgi:diaminopimelate decarboxylase